MTICDDEIRKLDFLNGELSPEATRAFARHLERCPSCRREVDELSGLTAALEAAPRPSAPEAFTRRAATALGGVAARRSAAQRPAKSEVWGGYLATAMAVGAAVAALLLAATSTPAIALARAIGFLAASGTPPLGASAVHAAELAATAFTALALPSLVESVHFLVARGRPVQSGRVLVD